MENETVGEGKNTWFMGYFFSNLAGGIISPLIPLFIIVYLQLGVFYVGLTTSIVSLASIPALVLWGNLSDSVKKRRIFILTGFLGSFLALLPISFAVNLGIYLFLQIMFQVLAMAAVPVSTLIIIENVEKARWPTMMSKFNLVASLGTLIGLMAGTVLISLYHGGSTILIHIYEIASFIYLVAAVTSYFIIPEPGKRYRGNVLHSLHNIRISERIRFFPSSVIHFAGLSRGTKGRPLKKEVWFYLLSTFFLMTAFQLYFVPFPVFIIKSLGGDSSSIFFMYMLNSLFGTIAYRFTGPIISKFGVRNVLGGTLFVRAILFSAMASIPFLLYLDAPFMLLSLAFYGIMGGLWGFIGISEVTYISRISENATRGRAIGYYNSLNGLGQIAGGLVSGILCAFAGYGIDFIAASLMVVIGGIIIVKLTHDGDYKSRFPRLRPTL